MALKVFSMRQLAYLIEEIQWILSSGDFEKQENQKSRNKNQLLLRKNKFLTLKSAIPANLSKRRLVRLLPWAGAGAAIAAMDPSMTVAVLSGGTLGWWIWQGQSGKSLGIGDGLKGQFERLNLRPDQRQLALSVASGGAIAIVMYGGLTLWNSFHNPWLVAGVVGQSGLTLAMVLMFLNQRSVHQEEERISRFLHLLDRLMTASTQQRPIFIQELFWLALKGRLDTAQQGMVLQTLQSLFVEEDRSDEKAQISAAIARFQQIQQSVSVSVGTGKHSVRALSGTTLENIHMPLGGNMDRQREQVIEGDQGHNSQGHPKRNPLTLPKKSGKTN